METKDILLIALGVASPIVAALGTWYVVRRDREDRHLKLIGDKETVLALLEAAKDELEIVRGQLGTIARNFPPRGVVHMTAETQSVRMCFQSAGNWLKEVRRRELEETKVGAKLRRVNHQVRVDAEKVFASARDSAKNAKNDVELYNVVMDLGKFTKPPPQTVIKVPAEQTLFDFGELEPENNGRPRRRR